MGRKRTKHKQERATAFGALREQYGFSEYALHEHAKQARVSWLAEHLDAVVSQTLATRAYQALNRVCLGKARRVRFKSRGRGLSSLENKRNDTGLRFVLQKPEEGHQGEGEIWVGLICYCMRCSGSGEGADEVKRRRKGGSGMSATPALKMGGACGSPQVRCVVQPELLIPLAGN